VLTVAAIDQLLPRLCAALPLLHLHASFLPAVITLEEEKPYFLRTHLYTTWVRIVSHTACTPSCYVLKKRTNVVLDGSHHLLRFCLVRLVQFLPAAVCMP